jgi:hypothetical protein
MARRRGSGRSARPARRRADCAPAARELPQPAMPLMTVVITLIVVGLLLWLVNNYVPMDGKIRSILNVVVVIAVVLWLLYAFGVLDRSGAVHMPKIQ